MTGRIAKSALLAVLLACGGSTESPGPKAHDPMGDGGAASSSPSASARGVAWGKCDPRAGERQTRQLLATQYPRLASDRADGVFVLHRPEFGVSRLDRIMPGGSLTTVATSGGGLGPIVVDATHVYWSDYSSVLRTTRAARETKPLFPGAAHEMAVSSTHVYAFIKEGPSSHDEFIALPLQAGSMQRESITEGTRGLLADESGAYYPDTAWTKLLRRPAGGGPEEIVSALSGRATMAIDDTHVYTLAAGKVTAISKANGEAKTLASVEGEGDTSPIAVDDTNIYFATHGRCGSIYAISKTGGEPRLLVAGEPRIDSLAVDKHGVYWGSIIGSDPNMEGVDRSFVMILEN